MRDMVTKLIKEQMAVNSQEVKKIITSEVQGMQKEYKKMEEKIAQIVKDGQKDAE